MVKRLSGAARLSGKGSNTSKLKLMMLRKSWNEKLQKLVGVGVFMVLMIEKGGIHACLRARWASLLILVRSYPQAQEMEALLANKAPVTSEKARGGLFSILLA